MKRRPNPSALPPGFFRERVREHLINCVLPPEPRRDSKCAKSRKKYSKSRALRFAECAARKDCNVYRSSHGKYQSVTSMRYSVLVK